MRSGSWGWRYAVTRRWMVRMPGWQDRSLGRDKAKALEAGCGRCLWLVWRFAFNPCCVNFGANLSFGVGGENEIYVLPSSVQGGPNCGLSAPWWHLRAVQAVSVFQTLRHPVQPFNIKALSNLFLSNLISSSPQSCFAGKCMSR